MNYKEEINRYFNDLYNEHGNSNKSVGYSKEGHKARFDVLSGLLDLNNKSILEVGCGLGHYLQYLQKKYKKFKYTGFDINENFIKECWKKYPKYDFELRNIIEKPVKENTYDAVYFVGGFNYSFIKNPEMMTKKMLKAMFIASRKVCAISMTSIYVDKEYKLPYMHYYDPCEIFTYAKTLTKKVSLYHNYLPHDFTIVLYK